MIIEIVGGEKIVVREEKAPSGLILVDGFNVGEIQEVVLRDRQMLAEDGVFVIYGIVDMRTRKMIKSPDIISRGFVYLRESQELLSQARLLAKKIIEKESAGMAQIDFDAVREAVRDAIEKFLFQETHKQPIVISVVFGI
jgi:ribonuclease J